MSKKKGKLSQAELKNETILKAVVVADSFDTKFYPVTLNKPRVSNT